jgi:homoserine kinase
MKPLAVRVPGSTSNCGAGFDTLGLALQIYNTIHLSPRADGEVRGERESDARADGMVAEAVTAFAAAVQRPRQGLTFRIEGDVPAARGLGSSVTILAGIVAGLNHWAGEPLSVTEVVRLITTLEGHPDNAMAGVVGGFCVGRCGESAADYVDLVRVEVPATLKFVVVSPSVEVSTKVSRGVLPARITHGDAVRSVNSAAYLTAAFVAGDYAKLKHAVSDFLHEPYRMPGITGARESIVAGIEAGALTGWLSGSGSSVLCVAEAAAAAAVAQAMLAAFADFGVEGKARELAADNHGLTIEA